MDNRRQGLRALARALPSIDQLLALPRRRFDEAGAGLGRGLQMNTLNKRRSFERVGAHLRSDMLLARLAERGRRVAEHMQRAERLLERRLDQAHARLSALDVSLRAAPARFSGAAERRRERLDMLVRRGESALS